MALLIDEIIVFDVLSLRAEHHNTSINLKVAFLFGISVGETIRAEAEVIHLGKINIDVRE